MTEDEHISEAAHKVMLLYKLLGTYCGFDGVKLSRLESGQCTVSLIQRNACALVRKISCPTEKKANKVVSSSKEIAEMYESRAGVRTAKKQIGIFGIQPYISCKEDLFGKAAIFDLIASLPYGFQWKKERYLTRSGELESLLIDFDLQCSSIEAQIEQGMVEHIKLIETLHRVDSLLYSHT